MRWENGERRIKNSKLRMEGYGLRIGTQDLWIWSCLTNGWYTYFCSSFVANCEILFMLTTYKPSKCFWYLISELNKHCYLLIGSIIVQNSSKSFKIVENVSKSLKIRMDIIISNKSTVFKVLKILPNFFKIIQMIWNLINYFSN